MNLAEEDISILNKNEMILLKSEKKQDVYKPNNNEEEFLYEGYPEYNVSNNYGINSNYYNQNNN